MTFLWGLYADNFCCDLLPQFFIDFSYQEGRLFFYIGYLESNAQEETRNPQGRAGNIPQLVKCLPCKHAFDFQNPGEKARCGKICL